tara:strand:- start:700 stop:1017 length:318 start_codon:yes stop_codon:yes gene_type:complete
MKKMLITIILSLIIATALTKNSTKKIDNQIFNIKEDLRILNDKYKLVLLDFNFLSSPNKLLEYQKSFFENELIPSNILNFKKIYSNKKIIIIEDMVKIENNNEKN